MKVLGLVVSDKIFENCNLNTDFWPRDLHMQLIRTIWIILVGDNIGTIPVQFPVKLPLAVQEKMSFELFYI